MSDLIPSRVQRFFTRYIESVAQWEGLLLLRAQPQREWNAASVAKGLYISEADTKVLLNHLTDSGLVTKAQHPDGPTYRLNALDGELEALLSEAADLYRAYLIPVTQFIHAKPRSRVQAFADAFRLRKD